MGIRPFSWGQFGRTPDIPEHECSGDFNEEVCGWCPDYDKCKKLEEDFIDDFEKMYYEENRTNRR